MAGALDDRVVLVTGAGGGIGREVALLAAGEGAKVVVNDLEHAQDVAARIGDRGGAAVANTASVADPDAARSIVTAAVDAFGRLDCVVNNAGILRDRIFHHLSVEDWRAVIDVHLNGTFYVSRAAADVFRAQGHGAFVHMTSTAGLIGSLGQANYAAAKMGIVGLSRSIAIDMARHGVRSNCVAPFAWSRLMGDLPDTTEEDRRRIERFKMMSADTVAPLVVFLASDLAQEISGQIVCVRRSEVFLFGQPRPIRSVHRDGGWTVSALAERALPAFRSSFTPLESSGDVFDWDPI